MGKRKAKQSDPRLETPPGHYLRNAPWRRDFVEEPKTRFVSRRDAIVLAFLVLCSVAVAAALWMNPPHIRRSTADRPLPRDQAVLARHRVPRPYNGLDYDPSKFEELKDNDPLVQDDLDSVLQDDAKSDKPTHRL